MSDRSRDEGGETEVSDLVKREPDAVAVREQPRDIASQLMQVISANPTAGAENLKALLDGMERITKWQAEQEFTAAFSRMKFPPIVKSKKGHSAKYADYADIQRIIDPILASEGFTLTFSSGEPDPAKGIPTHGLLSHIGGHSRAGVIYLPTDGVATRSGGMNMNALQATGSTTSYGMRYLAKMMLNLRFIGEDDDGAALSQITEEQSIQIEGMIADNALQSWFPTLLDVLNVKALSDLQRVQFATAINLIRAKVRAKGTK
jgi:hypothetical protein